MIVSTILLGGLANNLFQICNCIAYSLKYGIDYCIPTTIQSPHYEGQKVFYSPHLKYCDIESGERTIYIEPHFHYREIPKFDVDVLVLSGYFQSFRYLLGYRNELIKILNIPYEFKQGWVFLHYRLGDYKLLERFHQTISREYIDASMEYFIIRGYRKFLIFSDEIELAKKIICYPVKWYNVTLEYSEGKTEIEDLALMASCQHGVMSASSFSWFGAWLGKNENRQIIYPLNWFGTELSNHTIKDLCPPGWVGI